MSMQPRAFTPDMISAERRPFYDAFVQKTGEIAAKFVRTNPKPNGSIAGSLLDRINQVDVQVGYELLTMNPDNLYVPIISLPRGRLNTIPDLIENDPLTKGLITGDDLLPSNNNRQALYKSIIPDCSVFFNISKEFGFEEFDVIKSFLIGSEVLETGKFKLDKTT